MPSLLLNPELLILDEPTEGLAPIVVREIRERLRALKEQGLTILLVEHFGGNPRGSRDAERVAGGSSFGRAGDPSD